MRIMNWADFIATRDYAPLSVTIGVFDGVHRGHQRLMDRVLSRRPAMKAAVITFRDNPKKILRPQSFKGSIFMLDQKIDAFEAAGFDVCVLIDFSQNFGTLSGAEFLSLLANAGVKFVCVGPNFRCGHKMDTNAQALAEICGKLGVEARIEDPVLSGGHPVSSSRIRNAILEGRIAEAAEMLGRPYVVEIGKIESLSSGGFSLQAAEDALLPPAGAYEVVLDPSTGNESRKNVRVEGGTIIAASGEARGAKRVAIMNVVSQEWKEI